MATGDKEALSLMEAVDNLSSMAELDDAAAVQEKEVRGGLEKIHLVKWLDPSKIEENRELIKQSFKVLNNYLQHVYTKEKDQLNDVETQKGLQAIMVLAGEAAQKVDKFTALFKGAAATELPEYKDLQKFYLTKIIKRFQEAQDTEEAWEREWGNIAVGDLDIERRGLKDLETVRRDKEYELFYIKREDENPFFSRNLLRHIRLVGDFDETLKDSAGDDPFLKTKVIQDKDVQLTAKDILKKAIVYIDDFYKEAMRHKEVEFVMGINSALMALMLAANPRNLRENTTGKSCLSYFRDFHLFLRFALRAEEYSRYLSAPNPEKFTNVLINLSHALCCFIFLRIPTKDEAIAFIHKIIKKGETGLNLKPIDRSQPFWNILLEEDESIRALLKTYPNGPLLKTLDIFREEDEKEGFDPILQDNLPSQLFSFVFDAQDVSVLRIPAPIRQEFIQKAEVIEEFQAFLRYLNTALQGKKHLLFNLQDKTSWNELARCQALEEIQKKAEFSRSLTVVGLPKYTDFYQQVAVYLDFSDAKQFLETFKEQVASGPECGFYFSSNLNTEKLLHFANEAIDLIHAAFFGKKEVLTRRNRLDFIEIFYLLLEMKIIDLIKPDSLSFTCKDAIDMGAGAAVTFFSFLKMLTGSTEWSEKEKDFVLWMLYTPAFTIRERAIDPQCFNRTISAVAHLDIEFNAHKDTILESLKPLIPIKITLN